MSVIRVNFMGRFYFGDDAVLLTMDGAGVDTFRAALDDAERHGASRLDHDDVTHEFVIQPDAADIDLQPGHVVWRLDRDKAIEMIGILNSLANTSSASSGASSAGHQYVDINTPAETLVVSRDEYVDVVYPGIAPPP